MISIDPSDNSERENYKFLIGSIISRPIAFVTTVSNEGILNGAPFNIPSLAIQRNDGTHKDTARNIISTKEFVVHIVDKENVEKINKTAAALPPEQSEIELAQLTPAESTKISVPGVMEAKIRMECTLEQSLRIGGVDTPGCDLIIGKVVQFHIDENIYEKGRIDPGGLAAVSRLAGNQYAKIGDIFSIERPK
ncbi:Nitrilotriacetate monooxygenase component B [Bacillus sp. ZZV12-4809]|nr:Nitrilotriacetate monooxygenase component B [Bacillus sp. ZZV12-4809]